MKAWLRVPFSLLALLAMFATMMPGTVFATMMPGTVWACPMTGRVDTASRVCLGAMPMRGGQTPCAHLGGKCCKPLSVPTSQSDDDSGRQHIFAAPNHVSFSLAFVTPDADATPFVVPHTETFVAPAVRVGLARFASPPPPFWTWHRPLTVAGRAPPVVAL